MMKKLLSAAFAAMMLLTVPATAMAQSENTNTTCKAKVECKKECKKGDKKECKKGDKKQNRKMDKQACRKADSKACAENAPRICPNVCAEGCEFEGLNLTEQQKTQLKTLKTQRCEARKAQKDSMKQVNKEQKMKQREAMKSQREADRRSYLQEVKKIIGADNYVLFLENQYVQEGGRPGMEKGFGKGGPRKDFGSKIPARTKLDKNSAVKVETSKEMQTKAEKLESK